MVKLRSAFGRTDETMCIYYLNVLFFYAFYRLVYGLLVLFVPLAVLWSATQSHHPLFSMFFFIRSVMVFTCIMIFRHGRLNNLKKTGAPRVS